MDKLHLWPWNEFPDKLSTWKECVQQYTKLQKERDALQGELRQAKDEIRVLQGAQETTTHGANEELKEETMKPINLCPLIKDLNGEWVAFDDGYTKVIAHDKELEKVVEEAKEKGFEKPILLRVPDKFITQI